MDGLARYILTCPTKAAARLEAQLHEISFLFQLKYFDIAKIPSWYCSTAGAPANPLTQVMWAQSTKVGCGFISRAKDDGMYKKVRPKF